MTLSWSQQCIQTQRGVLGSQIGNPFSFELFHSWCVAFMYEWPASTWAVTCTSAVDKWFAMFPSVFIVVLVHLFLIFAFIVTIQLTLLLGCQVWGLMKVVYKFHHQCLQNVFRKFLFRCLGWFSLKSLEVLSDLIHSLHGLLFAGRASVWRMNSLL